MKKLPTPAANGLPAWLNCLEGGCGRESHQPYMPELTAKGRRREIARMSQQGRSAREIAEALGLGVSTVHLIRKELGLNLRRGQKKQLTEEHDND